MTAPDFLADLQARRDRFLALCSAADADPDDVSEAAENTGANVEALARRYPDSWWSRLQVAAQRLRADRDVRWLATVDDALRGILAAGDGPVDAMGGGLDAVRERVPPGVLGYLDRWQSRRDGGIVLTGPTESGKTMAALALAWRLHREANRTPPENGEPARPVWWVQAASLARCRAIQRLGTDVSELERACVRAPVLVLDDLLYGGHATPTILEVVAQRLNRGLATVTTTGHDEGALRAALGDAGVRRLLRVGAADGRILELGEATRG